MPVSVAVWSGTRSQESMMRLSPTLMVAYLTWAIDRLADDYGVDEPPTHPSLVRDSLVNYRPPIGKLLLAECDGHPAGVGALHMLDASTAEVKRMYVAPAWRNRQVGSAILDQLLDHRSGDGREHRTPGHMSIHDQSAAAVSITRFRGASSVRGNEIPPRLQDHWIFFERAKPLG